MEAEHLSQIQLVGYRAKTLNPDELLTVDRHLASCDACHDRLTRLIPEVSSSPSNDLSLDEPFHLDYDQHLAPYVDGTANEIDLEIIETHIALCSTCAEELRNLQEFSRQPLPPLPQTERDVRVSLWTRLMGQWPWPLAWNPGVTAALVIAMLVLAITPAFVLWTRYRSSQRVQHEGTASPSVADQQNPSTIPGQSPEQTNNNGSPDPRAVQSPDSRDEPLVALSDAGQQITLEASGRSTGLESLPPELRTTVENVLAIRRFNRSPALLNLSKSNGRLRGGSDEQDTIVPLTPDGVVIETDQPTFRWRPLEGASDYVVTVHDSNFRPIASSEPLNGTEWCVPRQLQRGVTYSWQIRAVVNGKTVISPKPPAPDVRFRILDQKAFAAIENARRTQGNAHLALAVLYWRHGLLDQAERELEALVRANPNSSAAAELLRSLRALRRP